MQRIATAVADVGLLNGGDVDVVLGQELCNGRHRQASFCSARVGVCRTALAVKALVRIDATGDVEGGDANAWFAAGAIGGCLIVVPWLPVYRVSFERPEFRRAATVGFFEGTRIAVRQRSYRILVSFYILSRIAMDLISAMFLLYFKVYIGREEDFNSTMALFLCVSVLSLPMWLRISKHRDKGTIFIVGSTWWIMANILIYPIRPDCHKRRAPGAYDVCAGVSVPSLSPSSWRRHCLANPRYRRPQLVECSQPG